MLVPKFARRLLIEAPYRARRAPSAPAAAAPVTSAAVVTALRVGLRVTLVVIRWGRLVASSDRPRSGRPALAAPAGRRTEGRRAAGGRRVVPGACVLVRRVGLDAWLGVRRVGVEALVERRVGLDVLVERRAGLGVLVERRVGLEVLVERRAGLEVLRVVDRRLVPAGLGRDGRLVERLVRRVGRFLPILLSLPLND